MKKRYTSDKNHHYLTFGKHKVAIIRKDSKRRTKGDEKELDRHMDDVLQLRNSEIVHKGGLICQR